ncbi:Reverse transcriptase zinc-binding domain [Sesbania bispinosa]|nr:Reverse transcriptase zinc-binding domain [Sesbania bispinosa]
MKAKYKVNGSSHLSVKAYNKDSFLWKGISKVWHHLDQCIVWILGDGNSTKFWTDNFIPSCGPIIHHATKDIPDWKLNIFVSSVVGEQGWNWDMFEYSLASNIISYISSIKPPDSSGGFDYPAWKFSINGEFTIKTAYEFIMELSAEKQHMDEVFKIIWSWQGPSRIYFFVWKVLQGRLLTNSERLRRGMTNTDLCPRCHSAPETLMHLLRDCEVVAELWESLINQRNWSSFFSLRQDQWIRKNLGFSNHNVAGVAWSFIFPIGIWSLWKDRNSLVFKQRSDLPGNLFFPYY